MTPVTDADIVALQGIPEIAMHQTTKLQFERIVREFARWRAVPGEHRPPAPGWWWGPALAVIDIVQSMPPDWCARLELPIGASFDAGARVLLASLADQTSLTWPGNFPAGAMHSELEDQQA